MIRGAGFLSFVAVLLMFAPFAEAQDDSQAAPIALGDFNLSGSATAGYRFDDIKGYKPQFREMFDLGRGFRVLDLSLFGESQDGKNPFADRFSLQTTSLGGDPFPTAQFTISKNKLYDLRVDWRQSYYFWNQNDNVVLPIAAVGTGLSKGLTSNHDWATVRKFGSVDFTLHATNNLRFHFNYYRPSDEGNTFTTRSLDFLGSPGFWGTFARANPYYLFAPLNDYTNRFTGGFDYTLKDWSFHYSIGYQTFTENISLNNVSSPELSINPIASSTTEPLTDLSWSQFRRLTTPISEFSFLGKPLPRL
ncbi:MAG TPA: MtrB/PioB family outer membrane beta-barrel protein, partial [Candidatus Acidoferrales bacterium]